WRSRLRGNVFGRERQAQFDARAFAFLRHSPDEARSDQTGAIAHVVQSAPPATLLLRRKARAIVVDADAPVAALRVDLDAHRPRAAVPTGVVDRFLDDAKNGHLRERTQPLRHGLFGGDKLR